MMKTKFDQQTDANREGWTSTRMASCSFVCDINFPSFYCPSESYVYISLFIYAFLAA